MSANKTSFKDLVSGETPVLIDFYAEWCGPCKAFAPVLERFKSEVNDQVKILKIDIDKNQLLASKLGVQSIPTLMVYKEGKMMWRKTGGASVAELHHTIGSMI